MTSVSFQNVSIAQGARRILVDVDLAIEDGEFIGMLGPNGSGKTTLMRAILGLQPIAAGAIEVLGGPAGGANARIGYMPQVRTNMAQARYTGWDYIAAALDPKRWGLPILGRAERREVDRVLDLVGARALANRPLRDMSGGERQRLLLSQALIGGPRLLLLDEPLMNLDPAHQTGVVEIVRRLQRDLKLTVLFSAHDLNPLLGAMDRVLYLAGGQAALGEVDDVMTSATLSRLYGSQIEVFRVNGRVFVMSGAVDVTQDVHAHQCGHHEPHAHEHAARQTAGRA